MRSLVRPLLVTVLTALLALGCTQPAASPDAPTPPAGGATPTAAPSAPVPAPASPSNGGYGYGQDDYLP